MFWHVPAVVGVGAGFAVFDGHTPTSVRTGQVGREIQIEDAAPERPIVRGFGGGESTDGQDLIRTRPVKHKFGLEYVGVDVRLHTLADGGERVVHPCPTTRNEVRCWAQRVGEGGVSAVNMTNGEGMVCENNVVRALLPVSGQVEINQVVAGQTLVSCRRRHFVKVLGGDKECPLHGPARGPAHMEPVSRAPRCECHGPDRYNLKFDGPGRAAAHSLKKLTGWAGPWPGL